MVVSNGVACYGALSRYLGSLATTLKRWDDAARHFEDALAMNARMDARPWLAHTQHQYATMLLARRQSGDRDKAATLLDAALATARELEMRALEERVTDATARMKPDLHYCDRSVDARRRHQIRSRRRNPLITELDNRGQRADSVGAPLGG